MPKPERNRAKVIGRLGAEGWTLLRHGADHDIYTHPSKRCVMSVPRHRTLSIGVARSIAKAAGWP